LYLASGETIDPCAAMLLVRAASCLPACRFSTPPIWLATLAAIADQIN
jgi:hypothetical protein